MKRMQRFLIIYGIAVTGVCMCLAVFSVTMLGQSRVDTTVKAQQISSEEDAQAVSGPIQYQLAIRTGQVVILKNNRIFETTGIEEENMSEELKEEVDQGISFDSAEDVYSFLESYSS
jgi:hypothetical protein